MKLADIDSVVEWNFDAAFIDMETGDSFFIPCVDCDAVARKIKAASHRFEYLIRINKEVHHDVQGVRVYRLK